jgi:RNA polymerase sigma-70 factor, ECF subfamily
MTPLPRLVTADVPSHQTLAAVRAGDAGALRIVFEHHAQAVLDVAYRLTGDADEAEDVVQDVFIGLPEALRQYDEQGSFAQWLRRVAARTTLMRLRHVDRREAVVGHEMPQSTSSEPALRLTIDTALDALPAGLRQVFVLKEVEGYSHAEIGGMLGIRTGTSEVRLHRAIKLLRKSLTDITP